jgi:Rho-binding antiterminator
MVPERVLYHHPPIVIMSRIIDCHIHDYIEIACLYGFQVNLELVDQTSIQGRAKTTETSVDKHEWLILEIGDQSEKVELSTIKSMQAITPNPHFDKIEF